MNNSTACSTSEVYPVISPDFILALKIIVGATCILSILGAGLIILTYVAFKDLRTTARQLLANLSVADIVVAVSHFVGLFHFQTFIPHYNPGNNCTVSDSDALCEVQAAFTMYGSVSLFLWTMAIAVYMLTIIVLKKPEAAKKLVFVFYPLCWGLPLPLVLWFGFAGYFGFQESGDIGWCYIKRDPESTPTTILSEVLGYEIWLYTAFIVLPVIYIAIFCHVKFKFERVNGHCSLSMHTRARTTDLKLIFVPLIFLLLRIWSAIIDVPVFYLHGDQRQEFTKTQANAVFVFLAGVGSSAQGLANAILFCAFTKQVRRRLWTTVATCFLSRAQWNHKPMDDEESFEESTTYFENTANFQLSRSTPLEGAERPLVMPNFRAWDGSGGKHYKSIATSFEE